MNIKSLFIKPNRVIYFVVSRYLTYGIQFLNSLLFAIYLGSYFLGVWGFFNLVIQYFLKIDFGIANSFQAIASVKKSDEKYVVSIFDSSLVLVGLLSTFVALIFFINYFFGLNIGAKYHFGEISILACLSIITNYFINLYSGLFRVFGTVFEIAFSQSCFPVLGLVLILVYHGANLIIWLTSVYFLASLISLVVFIIRSPIRLKFSFDLKLAKAIQRKGFYLFLYNAAFYLIVISTRTFISANYNVREFGYFTFAFSLSNVVLLLLQSFSFLIYPKLLNRLAHSSNENAGNLIERVKSEYVLVSHFLVHTVILVFPLFLIFFPDYSKSLATFGLCSLSIVLYTNCFGFQGLLVAKNREKKIASFSICALLLNIILSYFLTAVIDINFAFAIISTAISYLVLIFLITRDGRKLLGLSVSITDLIKSTFPIRLLIPYIISFVFIMSGANSYYFLIPFVSFIILNFRGLLNLKKSFNEIMTNKKIINI